MHVSLVTNLGASAASSKKASAFAILVFMTALTPAIAQAGASKISSIRLDASRVISGRTIDSMPLRFEVNQGQTAQDIDFLARGENYTVFLRSDRLSIGAYKCRATKTGSPRRVSSPDITASVRSDEESSVGSYDPPIVHVRFDGANYASLGAGADLLPGHSNYFLGNDPEKWRRNIPAYRKVRYEQVYPGVDVEYYGSRGKVEYDFVIAPGADPSVIRMQFEGARGLNVGAQGELFLETPCGRLYFEKPVIYQYMKGIRHEVSGAYEIMDDGAVTVRVSAYDGTAPLVIDPVLVYSTYLGGTGDDLDASLVIDTTGHVYVTGSTASANFPTASPLQAGLAGQADLFVTKLDPSGSTLIYSTFIGGSADEFTNVNRSGPTIAVDASGNAYVTGRTVSTNFPVTLGAFQTTFAGGANDAFVLKLNSTGSQLLYSTYLGGGLTSGVLCCGAGEYGGAIAVDALGNAVVAGATDSNDFPTTPGSIHPSPVGGGGDAFLTKLNADGSALIFSTYFGGSSEEQPRGIALDTNGNVYLAGGTGSTGFPTTPGAFQTTFNGGGGGSEDGFVMKVNADGSAIIYSTFLGGSGGPSVNDRAHGIAIDSQGNAYVTGFTNSTDFPTTANAFQTGPSGGFDAYVAKLNSLGSQLLYSTYLGGTGDDFASGIALDAAGNALVVGRTTSTNFPTLTPVQATNGGANDAFLTAVNPAGDALVFSTYLGGSNDDFAWRIAVDAQGAAFVSGETASANFPTTQGAFDIAHNGNFDTFVTKIRGGPPGPFACAGFEPPMDNEAVKVRRHRALPLKGTLADDSGVQVTDIDVVSPPAIQVLYDALAGGDAVDVTSDALPAVKSTEGNQFNFNGGTWQYNLDTRNYTAVGSYTVRMVSGDAMEYLIDPVCTAIFVVE